MVLTVDGVDHIVLHRKTDCEGMRETVVTAPIGISSSGFMVVSKIAGDVIRSVYYTHSILCAFAKFEEWEKKKVS